MVNRVKSSLLNCPHHPSAVIDRTVRRGGGRGGGFTPERSKKDRGKD